MLHEYGKRFEFTESEKLLLPRLDTLCAHMIVRRPLFFFLFFISCSQNKNVVVYSPVPGYDISNPVVIHLKPELDEISGIFYYAKDTSIFALNDEIGILYKIFIRNQIHVKKWQFSADGDYEDILLRDSTFYALQSNGNVKSFSFLSKDSIVSEDYPVPLFGNNGFESLYYDQSKKKIVALCKDCADDNKKTVSAYALDPFDGTFSDSAFYTIDATDIAEQLQSEPFKLKPSAAAMHPVTKDIYILSSVHKILVITGKSGKVKQVYRLNPKLFKQPEGITFSPKGDMFICNESAGVGSPEILIFAYKPLLNEKN